MFKPRTNQQDVHNPALSKEVGTKNKTKSEKNKKQKQSIDWEKKMKWRILKPNPVSHSNQHAYTNKGNQTHFK